MLFALPLLTACAAPPPPRAEILEVERTRFAPLPERLTAPTPAPDFPRRALFCDDLERALLGYQAALANCNVDKACAEAITRSAETGDPVPEHCGTR